MTIRLVRQDRSASERLRRVAVSALLDIAGNQDAPASARAQAATALLGLVGDLGAKAVPLKARELEDLTQLSPDEMRAEIAAAKR